MAEAEPWESRYAAALTACLRHGSEGALARAYELGRECLADGRGVVELVAAHHRMLGDAWAAARRRPGAQAVERAGAFLSEAVSAFEMTHRGFRDANDAVRRMHEFVEKEAKRIAYALHDGAGQLLAAVHLQIDDATRDLPPATRRRVNKTRRLLGRVETQLRDLAHEIRPAVLDDLGLLPALEALAESYSRRTRIAVAVTGRQPRRLPPAVETALYRMVQEALTNVRKHARARHVTIGLRDTGTAVDCRVRDDGIGFNIARARRAGGGGLGLPGMRERAEALGGRIACQSAPKRGTSLAIHIPLERF